ncbi:hypothetical protein LDG_7160 [Legionella drancourtii LLAP12]|uniref:Uncharacterized protein n=1 Tax=Legionella drancourtii LLAP12 TaxID=658187 RepID=G9EPH6_9GAMM|nr:hypothetical protein LDG_7160 [Legionella drancourtii LLAP12]
MVWTFISFIKLSNAIAMNERVLMPLRECNSIWSCWRYE